MATLRTVTVKTSGGDYTTLSGAEAGEQADLPALDRQLDIECYSMQDTTAVTVLGYTTDATRYIRILVPTTERHAGAYSASKYRLEAPDGSTCLTISENYVRVLGLQVGYTNTGANTRRGIHITTIDAGGADILIEKCLIRALSLAGSATNHYGFQSSDADATVTVRNCIAYRFTNPSTSRGFVLAGGIVSLENCTAYDCDAGFYRSAGTVTATNCGAAACAAGFSGTMTQTTCSDATPTFVSTTAGSEDFHLQAGDTTWKDQGTDLSGTFTDDIDGETRGATWDIGADEYVAGGGGTVYEQAVAGSLPAGSGALATAVTFVRVLSGDLPAGSGGLVRLTTKVLAGALGDMSGGTTKLTTRALVGDMAAGSGALVSAGIFAQAATGIFGAFSGAVSAVVVQISRGAAGIIGSLFRRFIG